MLYSGGLGGRVLSVGLCIPRDVRQKYGFMAQKVNDASLSRSRCLLLLPRCLCCFIYLFVAVSQISLLGDSGINSINARLMKQNVNFPRSQG